MRCFAYWFDRPFNASTIPKNDFQMVCVCTIFDCENSASEVLLCQIE